MLTVIVPPVTARTGKQIVHTTLTMIAEREDVMYTKPGDLTLTCLTADASYELIVQRS